MRIYIAGLCYESSNATTAAAEEQTGFRSKRNLVQPHETHLCTYKVYDNRQYLTNEKSAQRDANTARALAVVRFGHRPPATNTPTDRTDYNTLRRS